MKTLIILGALASTVHAGSFAAPKLYAAMFEKGHRWTFDVKTKGKDAQVMTCEVADVKTYANGIASKITCDLKGDNDSSFGPAGVWAATAKGLSSQEGDDFPEAIEDHNLTIAAKPRASRTRTNDDEHGYSIEKVFAKGKQWCTSYDSSHSGAGDMIVSSLCFKPGVGLTSGEYHMLPGSPDEQRDIVYSARD